MGVGKRPTRLCQALTPGTSSRFHSPIPTVRCDSIDRRWSLRQVGSKPITDFVGADDHERRELRMAGRREHNLLSHRRPSRTFGGPLRQDRDHRGARRGAARIIATRRPKESRAPDARSAGAISARGAAHAIDRADPAGGLGDFGIAAEVTRYGGSICSRLAIQRLCRNLRGFGGMGLGSQYWSASALDADINEAD